MRRKDKKEEKLFIPSPYQEKIFDYIKNGSGNLVIEAVAGSGKSTTLVHALKIINDDKRILFCAFNKDIVTELEKKIKQDNVLVTTIHSLGLNMLKYHFKDMIDPEPNPSKYRSHILNHIKEYSTINLNYLSKINYIKYVDNITLLVNLLRVNLIDNAKDAKIIVDRHGIDLIGDEVSIALKVMDWGMQDLSTIDYTDMIWLPIVLHLNSWGLKFDYIFVDEAQDLSIAQKELIFKCQVKGTRFVIVGDGNQCIYSFNGADPKSFDNFKNMPNTISLPLSISYRCSKKVVRFAQNLVPIIEYKDDAIEGDVLFNVKYEDVADGDMILCRNNAPLMQVYTTYLKLGRKCFIRGKDIGKNLIKFAKSANCEELNTDVNKDGVFLRLYNHLFETRDKIANTYEITLNDAIQNNVCVEMLDKIKALEVLSRDINTMTELEKKINEIFSDRQKEGISLSTIHKAKGLEANNVYIACRSLMPSKSAKKDWEILQEHNLIYVAYTRAKNKLGFLSEDDFKSFIGDEVTMSLNNIERKVNIILNKKVVSASTVNAKKLNETVLAKTRLRETRPYVITPTQPQQTSMRRMGKTRITDLQKMIYR